VTLKPNQTKEPRGLCLKCLRSSQTCYCQHIRSFDPKIRFVILIHKREAQKSIATGRMSHLCLSNSLLLEGFDNYDQDPRVNSIIQNPLNHCVILYPGADSINLSQKSPIEPLAPSKQLVIFVIDGTWITARKTIRRSKNLSLLPQICFSPARPSRFRIRKQPNANCYSTIEAIHHVIELLGPAYGLDTSSCIQDGLLNVFDQMVEQQILLTKQHIKYTNPR
jgi:DTW domain-containing protein YfiP